MSALDAPRVRLSREGAVATLTLDRPDKLNALNAAVFVELRAHLDALAGDRDVGCVILRGAGRSFCAGHDLDDLAAGDALETRHFEAETVDRLEALPMPTIARIQGHCLTGGLELALGCDLLVAADDARLGDTHGKWGLVPVWGLSVRLPERVGRSAAKRLMFTSRLLDGTQAQAIGLVDVAVPAAQLDETVESLAREIVANSSGSNRIGKALLTARDGRTREAALRFERDLPFGLPEDSAQRLAGAASARGGRRGA